MKLTPNLPLLAATLYLGAIGHALPSTANGEATIDFPILFSELDGSAYDTTCGGDNLVIVGSGLIIEGGGRIEVDSPSAQLIVDGTLIMRDFAEIVEEDVWPLPIVGPTIEVTAGYFEMHDHSRIRARGGAVGGSISIVAGNDFVMNGFSRIESTSSSGYSGGNVSISALGRIAMDSIFSTISVQGDFGGVVSLFTLGSVADDSISIRGRVQAYGMGSRGVGGSILLHSSNGGLFIPGTKKLLATGQAVDGTIGLSYVTVIGPTNPPNVKPAPVVLQN